MLRKFNGAHTSFFDAPEMRSDSIILQFL